MTSRIHVRPGASTDLEVVSRLFFALWPDGFIEVGLRSHADGCDTRHPVGFIEGWYVEAAHRGSGVGSALMRTAEGWARSQGCRELASDTWIDHEDSLRAHEALGFEVVDRCVHFKKSLDDGQ